MTDLAVHARVREAAHQYLGPVERSLLMAWTGFGATFVVTRAVTHWIKAGNGPSDGGVTAGGRHIHHYNYGILLLAAVGAIALHGEEAHLRHPLTASAYGSGAALIVDELALLINLQDVYWAKEGRTSVDVAVGIIALGGTYLAAAPFWNSATREVLSRWARRVDEMARR